MEDRLTIAKLYQNLPRLRVNDSLYKEKEKVFPIFNTIPIVDKNSYVGIEVEVENVLQFSRNETIYWTNISDGSLRNRGQEFITPPIRAYRVETALTQLFSCLNESIDFSERTSIHVHLNVRTLTIDQLVSLLLIYMMFEKVLFKKMTKKRENNIFCVPLYETELPRRLAALIDRKRIPPEWDKYTALNLLPIREKGTVEFRHMHGTKDVKHLITWLNMILCMKKFALKHEPEYIKSKISTLNTSSEYREFGADIFGDLIHTLYDENFNKDVSSCISNIKDECYYTVLQLDTIPEEPTIDSIRVPPPIFTFSGTLSDLAQDPLNPINRQMNMSPLMRGE